MSWTYTELLFLWDARLIKSGLFSSEPGWLITWWLMPPNNVPMSTVRWSYSSNSKLSSSSWFRAIIFTSSDFKSSSFQANGSLSASVSWLGNKSGVYPRKASSWFLSVSRGMNPVLLGLKSSGALVGAGSIYSLEWPQNLLGLSGRLRYCLLSLCTFVSTFLLKFLSVFWMLLASLSSLYLRIFCLYSSLYSVSTS